MDSRSGSGQVLAELIIGIVLLLTFVFIAVEISESTSSGLRRHQYRRKDKEHVLINKKPVFRPPEKNP